MSKIDLFQAYLQMELEEEFRKFLTISTHLGFYQYNQLQFGVVSAPALFQRAIDEIFQDVLHVTCYIDDILVTGMDEHDHLANLKETLSELHKYGV